MPSRPLPSALVFVLQFLSPPVLYELGLPAAIDWLAEQLESRHRLRVSVQSDSALSTLDDELSALLFRAVRELLTNVVKHANTATASVTLRREVNDLCVTVQDGGDGFDPSRLHNYEATDGFGLFSVSEQITRLGGSFDVATRPGHGAKITLRVPLGDHKSDFPP